MKRTLKKKAIKALRARKTKFRPLSVVGATGGRPILYPNVFPMRFLP